MMNEESVCKQDRLATGLEAIRESIVEKHQMLGNSLARLESINARVNGESDAVQESTKQPSRPGVNGEILDGLENIDLILNLISEEIESIERF